jgi:hypothetical protein
MFLSANRRHHTYSGLTERCWVYFVLSAFGLVSEANVTTRVSIAVLIYMVVQAVIFGVGALLVLATPLQAEDAGCRDCEFNRFRPDLVVSGATSASPILEG